jgi:hypothetical protein
VVAVLFQTWEATGDAAAVGALGVAQALPRVLGGLAGGSLREFMAR